MGKIGFLVSEGHKSCAWKVPDMGSICMLHYFEQHRATVEGQQVIADQPHYLLDAIYTRPSGAAHILIRFVDGDIDASRGSHHDGFEWCVNDKGQEYKQWKQAAVHTDEAVFVCKILMGAGQEEAEQASPALMSLQDAVRPDVSIQAFPPAETAEVLARRIELGWV